MTSLRNKIARSIHEQRFFVGAPPDLLAFEQADQILALVAAYAEQWSTQPEL